MKLLNSALLAAAAIGSAALLAATAHTESILAPAAGALPLCSTYCTAGTTTNGCSALMSCAGTPSTAATSGFVITATGVEGVRNGRIRYSLQAHPTMPVWVTGSTSHRCIGPGIQPTPIQNSGGTFGQCDGVLSIDFLAYMASNSNALGNPMFAGQTFYAQAIFQDPGVPGFVSLSDGLTWTMVP